MNLQPISFVLVLLVAPTGIAMVSNGTTAPTNHDPIVIDDPNDLVLPDAVSKNGLRGGKGTADDPYRISDWTITTKTGTAISITNIPAVFVLSGLALDGTTVVRIEGATAVVLSDSSAQGIVRVAASSIKVSHAKFQQAAIEFIGAGSVDVSDSTFTASRLVVHDAKAVTMAHIVATESLGFEFGPDQAPEVRLEDTSFAFSDNATANLVCRSCKNFVLSNATLLTLGIELGSNGNPSPPALLSLLGDGSSSARLEHVTIKVGSLASGIIVADHRATTLNDVDVSGFSAGTAVRLAGDFDLKDIRIHDFARGIDVWGTTHATIDKFLVKGTRFEGLRLRGTVGSLAVEDSVFQDVACAIAQPGIPGAAPAPSEYGTPPTPGPVRMSVHHSSFTGAYTCVIFLAGPDSIVDARENWWGTGKSPRTSEEMGAGKVSPGVTFDPYLDTSPQGLPNETHGLIPAPSLAGTIVPLLALGLLLGRRR